MATRKGKTTTNKTDAKSQSETQSKIKTWFIKDFWKVCLVGLIVFGAYGFYLNAQIKHTFSGSKWQIPAQIYARSLTLEVGEGLSQKELLQELNLLGYRRVKNATKLGEFSFTKNTFRIVRRPFEFPMQSEAQRHIEVVVHHQKVQKVTDLGNKEPLSKTRLEPWLVTRLMSGSQEDRMLVGLQDVPEGLVQALLITEDKEFYHHQGVAPFSILRALLANLAAGKTVQGGSTLTQQLVKNLYLTRDKSIWRKFKEAYMAILLDSQYSKDAILEAYLNEVFLGQNGKQAVHGFGLASWYYFDRPLNEIGVAELSTLVAMIKGPSRYNPRKYPERVIGRRDLILRLLYENEHINSDQYQYYVQRPLGVVETSRMQKHVHPAFMDRVNRELRQVLPNPATRQSGIKVYTSLDPHAQRNAEASATSFLPGLEKSRKLSDLDLAMVLTDIDSGEVRALVGSRNVAYPGFNRAIDARRPIGSLVKPAIYLTALEQPENYHLASLLKDEPIKLKSSYGQYWEPQNADKKFRGQVTLLDALTKSLNVPTVHLGMALGTDNVAQTMYRLGVKDEVPLYPAMTLGAVDLSPIQVNQMYQTIANAGQRLSVHAINAITSHDDQPLWYFDHTSEAVITAEAAYLVNYALHKVTQTGTAKELRQRFPKVNLAGKTGTTDDNRDSWFSGFDNDLVATVWIGKDNNEATNLTGANGALQYYIDFQKRQQPRSLSQSFPDNLGIAQFDPNTGMVVGAGCAESISLPAVMDALPQPVSCNRKLNKKEQKSFWERLFGS